MADAERANTSTPGSDTTRRRPCRRSPHPRVVASSAILRQWRWVRNSIPRNNAKTVPGTTPEQCQQSRGLAPFDRALPRPERDRRRRKQQGVRTAFVCKEHRRRGNRQHEGGAAATNPVRRRTYAKIASKPPMKARADGKRNAAGDPPNNARLSGAARSREAGWCPRPPAMHLRWPPRTFRSPRIA